jgi:hypothetical protein
MLGEVVVVLLQAQLVLAVLVVVVMERPLVPALLVLAVLVVAGVDQGPIILQVLLVGPA